MVIRSIFWRRVRGAVHQDTADIVRDPAVLADCGEVPLLLLFILAAALTSTPASAGQDIAFGYSVASGIHHVRPTSTPPSAMPKWGALIAVQAENSRLVCVVIPVDFARQWARQHLPPHRFRVITDGGETEYR